MVRCKATASIARLQHVVIDFICDDPYQVAIADPQRNVAYETLTSGS
jgi:hypothetical protein